MEVSHNAANHVDGQSGGGRAEKFLAFSVGNARIEWSNGWDNDFHTAAPVQPEHQNLTVVIYTSMAVGHGRVQFGKGHDGAGEGARLRLVPKIKKLGQEVLEMITHMLPGRILILSLGLFQHEEPRLSEMAAPWTAICKT
jgi:hypothetical protein